MVALLALLACTDRVESPAADTGDSGAESAPLDADGDGYTTVDDCDDTDPAVFPGAAERCDTRDWNCDGDPYDSGVCGEPIDLEEVAVGTWDGQSIENRVWGADFLGDLDGDGREELGLAGVHEFYVVAGGSALSVGRNARDDAFAWWHGRDGDYGRVFGVPAGDVNGDGASDLWYYSGEDGPVGLFLGPSSRWGRDQVVDVAADAYWRVGSHGVAVAEFDADGFSDAAFYYQWSWSSGERGGAVHVVLGAPDAGATQGYFEADISMDCAIPYGIAAGDVTGDGLGDLLVARASQQQVVLLDGQDLPGADGGNCDVVGGTFVVPRVAVGDASGWGVTVAVIGDWTGDGIDDWMGEDHRRSVDHYDEGALYVVPGGRDAASLGTVDVETVAEASLLGGADWTTLGGTWLRAVADVNGDGAFEVTTTMDTPDEHVGIILPSAHYAGLGVPLPRQVLRLRDPSGSPSGISSLGDYDGDGFLDILVVGDPARDFLGRAWLVSGAGIPWDDPSAW